MKKMLMIAKNFHGYEQLIIEEIEKRGIRVDYIDYNEELKKHRKYSSIFEMIYSHIYLKPIKKINKKVLNAQNSFNEMIFSKEEYDYFFTVADLKLPKETLKILRTKARKMINVLWDTITLEKIELEGREYFDKIFSYDLHDCEEFELDFLPNFYHEKKDESIKIEYDIFSVMLVDNERVEYVEKLTKTLKKLNIQYNFKLYNPKKQNLKSNYLKIIDKPISIKQANEYVKRSKAILEITRKGQRGLSFRAIEALGMEKKLVTTNAEILKYDFYNSQNILILSENTSSSEIRNFFETPYKKLKKDVYEKYSLKSWINQILFE